MKKNKISQIFKEKPIFFYLSVILVALIIFFIGITYASKTITISYKAPKVERSISKNNHTDKEEFSLNTKNDTKLDKLSSMPATSEDELSENEKEVKLYYVMPEENGLFTLKSNLVTIKYDGKQELTATLNALLSNKKFDKNHYNMIPDGTKLLSITVENGVAYLNFNDAFRFNTFGIDGYKAQLNQVVYTATEFDTVKEVKILIEGKEIDYLHEGVDISKPLRR